MQLAVRVKPSVVVWYKVFCAAHGSPVRTAAILGVFVLNSFTPNDEAFIDGILLVILGPPFAVAYGLGFFWEEKPWHWIYGIVLIGISLTSCCCFPVSIPLLIYWLKPETNPTSIRIIMAGRLDIGTSFPIERRSSANARKWLLVA